MSLRVFVVAAASLAVLAGCSSSKIKERKEQRDRVAQSSKIYCDFVNGEQFPDIEVAVNLEMAKRCDSEKPFTLTNYKTPAENPGVLYCCSIKPGAVMTPTAAGKKAEKNSKQKNDDEFIE